MGVFLNSGRLLEIICYTICVLVTVSLVLTGCTPGKRPFLMVQMCLSNAKGIEEFVEELKSVAAAEKLEFVDNSGNAQGELDALSDPNAKRTGGSRMLDLRLTRNDGMGIGAGNVGLPGGAMPMAGCR